MTKYTLNGIRSRLFRTKVTNDREWLIKADQIVRAAPDYRFWDNERAELLADIQKRFDAAPPFSALISRGTQ